MHPHVVLFGYTGNIFQRIDIPEIGSAGCGYDGNGNIAFFYFLLFGVHPVCKIIGYAAFGHKLLVGFSLLQLQQLVVLVNGSTSIIANKIITRKQTKPGDRLPAFLLLFLFWQPIHFRNYRRFFKVM